MERRTFLKGILGAAAAAFAPAKLTCALDTAPEPLVQCLKTGDYLVATSCGISLPEPGFHQIRILSGERVVGLGELFTVQNDPDDPILKATINMVMKLHCKAGDRLDLAVFRNGIQDVKARADATLTITEIPS